MKKLILFLFVGSLLCSGSFLSAAENTVPALKAQMKKMVKELESDDLDDRRSFLKKYVEKKMFDKWEKEGALEKVLERFDKKRREFLSKAIEFALKVKPEIAEDKVTYTFDMKKAEISDAPKRGLQFVYSPEQKNFHVKN